MARLSPPVPKMCFARRAGKEIEQEKRVRHVQGGLGAGVPPPNAQVAKGWDPRSAGLLHNHVHDEPHERTRERGYSDGVWRGDDRPER